MSDLPPGWVLASLADVGTWGSGGTPKRTVAEYYDGGDIPWAVIGDLDDGVVTEAATCITEEGLAESSAKMVEPGTLLIAMYGSIGKLGIAGIPMATNQAIAFHRPNQHFDTKYLFWYLTHQRPVLATSGKGATQQNISQTVLKAWPVPVPPLAEQRRIVDAIEEHFTRIDAAEHSLQDAERRIDALGSGLLSHVLDPDGPTMSLEELCVVFSDCPHRTPVYLDGGSGHAALRPRDVVGGRLALDTAAKVDDSEYEVQTARHSPVGGDIVYSRELSYGWAVVLPDQPLVCLSQGMVVFRPDPERMLSEFMALVLNSSIGRRQAHAAATGSAHPHLNLRDIRKYAIPAPPVDDQRRAVDFVAERGGVLDRAVAQLSRATSKASALRRRVLTDAFAGRLVPQDPNDDPAQVVLERIRAERATAKPKKRARKKVAK